MGENMMGGCTGSCHTCGSNAGCDGEKKESFFDKMERVSEAFDDVGEDEVIRMLDEITEALEKENAE